MDLVCQVNSCPILSTRTTGVLGNDRLLRMPDDLVQVVDLALDRKVETPITIDAGLPKIDRLIVFFSAERRMVEVRKKQAGLLFKCLADRYRRRRILF